MGRCIAIVRAGTPTPAEQRSYRTWISNAAAAVGDTPTAIVIQPDPPFAVYLWFGRPRLFDQNSPFVISRAQKLVLSIPFR